MGMILNMITLMITMMMVVMVIVISLEFIRYQSMAGVTLDLMLVRVTVGYLGLTPLPIT
jgi:hypothetical protein